MPLLSFRRLPFSRERGSRPGSSERGWKCTPPRSESAEPRLPSSKRPGRSVALLVSVGVSAFALACSLVDEVEQPIAFVHKIHVAEEEIPCTDCHTGAEEAEHATIPGPEICLDCHEDPMGESTEEIKLVEMLTVGDPIPWKRVHKLREHVRFSHRRHVVAGRVLCERCHGEVAELERPFRFPFIAFNAELGMERCIACHLESGNPRASIDCALCHR